MLITPDNLDEAAALHARHTALVEALTAQLADEHACRVAVTVARLYAAKVDPVVIAKTLLVGDRIGTAMYEVSCRAPALAADERAAIRALSLALRGMSPETAVRDCAVGAVFLASQFEIRATMLRDLVQSALPRPLPVGLRGAGAVDLADHGALGRERLMDLLGTEHPEHAVLEADPTTLVPFKEGLE